MEIEARSVITDYTLVEICNLYKNKGCDARVCINQMNLTSQNKNIQLKKNLSTLRIKCSKLKRNNK